MSSVASSLSRLSLLHDNPYSYMNEAKIENLLKCGWCHMPYVEPVSNGIDKTFCRRCLADHARHLASNRTPEADQVLARIKSYKPVTEPLILAMLDGILVRCTKCDDINIQRGNFKKHKDTECMKADVLCTAADIKCNWVGLREDLEEHESECKFAELRPVFEYLFNEQNELRSRLQQLEQDRS